MKYKAGQALDDARELISNAKGNELYENQNDYFGGAMFRCMSFGTRIEASIYQGKLFNFATNIENETDTLIEEIRNIKISIFGAKGNLSKLLNKYFELNESHKQINMESETLQLKTLSVNHCFSSDEIKIVTDVIEDTYKKLNTAFTLINQKLTEISNIKVSATNIILSVSAIVIAIIAIFI